MSLEKSILTVFSENIRYYRKLQNISQEELSFRADLHRTYIGMIEREERTATIFTLAKIASALGVSFDDLLIPKPDYSILNGKRVRKASKKLI